MLTTPMNAEQISYIIAQMKPGDEFTFAEDGGVEYPSSIPDSKNCTGWYFVRAIEIEKYGSKFVLIDYCGGLAPMCIPMDWNNPCLEEICLYIQRYFREYLNYVSLDKAVVFVDSDDFKVTGYYKIEKIENKARAVNTHTVHLYNVVFRNTDGVIDETQIDMRNWIDSCGEGREEFNSIINSLKDEMGIRSIISVEYDRDEEVED